MDFGRGGWHDAVDNTVSEIRDGEVEEDSLLESSSSSLDSSTPDLESSLNSNVGSGDHDKYPSISSEDGESVEHEKINPKQDNMIQLLLSQLRLAHDGPSNEPQDSRTFGK